MGAGAGLEAGLGVLGGVAATGPVVLDEVVGTRPVGSAADLVKELAGEDLLPFQMDKSVLLLLFNV